jgi:diguanylate cyclase (GGDEF)-like protein
MTAETPAETRGSGILWDTVSVVLLGLAALSATAAVGGELLLRAGSGLVPAGVAVIDAALSLLLLAAVMVRASRARGRRDTADIRSGLERIAWGAALVYPGRAAAIVLAQWSSADLAVAVEAVTTLLALPLIAVGLVKLTWPRRLSKAQMRVLIADASVGSLGLAVIWMLTVFPAAAQAEDFRLAGFLNAGALLLAATLLLVLIAAARRRAALPARQLFLIHGAIALQIAAGAASFVVLPEGSTSVPVTLIGTVLGIALFVLFCMHASAQPESRHEARARELYASVVPLLPIPLASLVLVGVLAADPGPAGTAQILGGVLLILLLVSVVVLRALASSELRNAAREHAGAQLTSSTEEDWFQVLVGRNQELTLVLHRDGRIAYATPSVRQATGFDANELRGRLFASLLSGNGANETAVRSLMAEADGLGGEPGEAVDLLLRVPQGVGREVSWRFTALVGLDIEGYLVHGRDVTDERRMEALLAESVSRDTLTGLHSRSGFVNSTADRRGTRCVLVINLRRFTAFNDQYGASAGDQVLRQVAQMLRDLPGPVSDPARLTADTYAMLVTGSVPVSEVVSAAARIREALRMMTLPDGRPLPLDVAAGYAVSDSDDTPMAELLSRAELAMTNSRGLERSPLVRFDPKLRLASDVAAATEADLRSALRDRSLVVRYQPIVRLSDGAVVGAEALVRRRRADGSLESPEVFIPVAEQLGLVDEVDNAVLMRALGEMSQVAEAVGRPLPVSVNVSASELNDGLEHRVLDALAETRWRPEHLVIEVTETALAMGTDEASRLLRRLQQAGCQVAMDDFGTGYSSMASLVEMPVDIVKIDASFTHRLTAAGRGLAMMRAIVEIGRSLNLVTLAEGLSSVEQADLLRGMGCDRGQGYLYAPPLTPEQLIDYVRPDGAVVVME